MQWVQVSTIQYIQYYTQKGSTSFWEWPRILLSILKPIRKTLILGSRQSQQPVRQNVNQFYFKFKEKFKVKINRPKFKSILFQIYKFFYFNLQNFNFLCQLDTKNVSSSQNCSCHPPTTSSSTKMHFQALDFK